MDAGLAGNSRVTKRRTAFRLAEETQRSALPHPGIHLGRRPEFLCFGVFVRLDDNLTQFGLHPT